MTNFEIHPVLHEHEGMLCSRVGCPVVGVTIKNDMKTSAQIIEEAVKDIPEYGQLHCEDCCVNQEDDALRCDVGVGDMDCCENMRIIGSILRSAILQAMKTAVEEVTPEKKAADWENPAQPRDEYTCEIGYNIAISDMEEKKRKFFE